VLVSKNKEYFSDFEKRYDGAQSGRKIATNREEGKEEKAESITHMHLTSIWPFSCIPFLSSTSFLLLFCFYRRHIFLSSI